VSILSPINRLIPAIINASCFFTATSLKIPELYYSKPQEDFYGKNNPETAVFCSTISSKVWRENFISKNATILC